MMRPPINPPRALTLPERCVQRVAGLFDALGTDHALELSLDGLERDAQASGFVAMQDAMADGINVRRRHAWRARFGGKGPAPLSAEERQKAPTEALAPSAAEPSLLPNAAPPIPLFPGRRPR